MGKKPWGLNFQEGEQKEVRVKWFLKNGAGARASKVDGMGELGHKSAAGDKISSWAEISGTYKIIFFLETLIFFFSVNWSFLCFICSSN